MPAVSKAQQRFMGMVHAADKGETPASPEVAKVSADMKDSDAKDFASTKHDGLPDHVKEQLKSVVREVIREKNGMNEMSGNDVHFKHIMKMYDRGGSFTKKKIGAVVCKDPKASRKDIEEALFDADYRDIIEFEDELGLKEIREKYSSINEEFKHVIHVDTPTQVVSKPIAAQILALAKKGVRSNEIGLEMGFVGNQKMATDAFQKVKNQIYFSLDKRNESINEGKKVFKVNPGIGSSKYSISSHDGVKKHNDGSDFYDIKIFKNKVDLEKGIKDFKSKGFIEESINEAISKDAVVRTLTSDKNAYFLTKDGNGWILDITPKAAQQSTFHQKFNVKDLGKGHLGMKYKLSESLNEAMGNDKSMAALVDMLSNSMEHYSTESKFASDASKIAGFGNLKSLFKDVYNDYWDLDAKKRNDYTQKDWLKWLEKWSLAESINEEESHDCGCNENHDCGCGGVHEHTHIHEDLSADANGIAGLTASRASAVKDFLEKNNIDSNKLYLFLKKGNLKDRMDFVTALVGKPGNPIQKKVIKQFSN